MGLFRYPGGKQRISTEIIKYLHNQLSTQTTHYIEPFVGAGGILLPFLKTKPALDCIHLNDLDYSIYCVWWSVYNSPNLLCSWLESFYPTVDTFYRYKEDLQNVSPDHPKVEVAMRKIALHQMSFSGLGEMGGPIGGKEQRGRWGVGCRWNIKRLCARVNETHSLLSRYHVVLTNKCFFDTIGIYKNALHYCDPPYFEKGNQLYKSGMTLEEHVKLFSTLSHSDNWVLSYDNVPTIVELYKDKHIYNIDVKYSVGEEKNSRKKSKELVITSHEFTS